MDRSNNGGGRATANGTIIEAPRHVVAVRHLTAVTSVVTIERGRLPIQPGQHVTLGLSGAGVNREYSAYTIGPGDRIEFLIHARPDGTVSQALRDCAPGTPVDLAGPFGAFVIAAPADPAPRYTLIASGVGIAPFHAFVTAYPGLDFQLLHGVRRLEDRYDMDDYPRNRYIACVTGEGGGDFSGRVTAYLEAHPADPGRLYYLCGRNAMVSDVFDQLRRQGVPSNHLFTEVFF